VETGTWLGVGALLVSAAGALNSMRNGNREDRSNAVSELRTVVDTYKAEIERLKVEHRESEEECRKQIAECNEKLRAQQQQVAEMRETIVSQANQIQQLERRREAR
jgi:TolA-binding protein